MGDPTNKVYMKQGGDVQVVASGGAVNVDSGGKIGRVGGVTFVIGTEGSNIINVGIQLEQPDGTDLDEVVCVRAFLSDASTGIGLTAGVPDGSVAIGTDGAIIETTLTDGSWLLQSEVDGDIDIDINDVTGTPTWYLVVILPDGTQVVSDAITFA